MITILAAQIFIQAFVLCLILYLVARYEADYSFQKVAMVSGGIMAGTLVIEALAVHKLGIFVIIPQIAFIAFMLMTFCWISLWKSLLVVVLFSVVHVGFSFGLLAMKTKFFGPDDGLDPAEKAEQQFKELEQEMLKTMGVWPEDGEGGGDDSPDTVAPGAEPADSGDRSPRKSFVAAPARLKAESSEKDPAVAWSDARAGLNVGGVMTGAGGKRVVLIDGTLYEAGDTVSATHGDVIYRWRIIAIREEGAELQPLKARQSGR